MKHSLKIHYEDDDILIVEKPPFTPCLPKGGPARRNLMSTILEIYPEQASSVKTSSSDMGLVHRLDNDTSGLVLIARNDKSWISLRKQFNNKSVHKEYIALVMGSTPSHGSIRSPIAHHERKRKKMVVCESDKRALQMKAREANTDYRTISHLSAKYGNRTTTYSLLSVVITTGVRHQIRAHLASMGFPISGDKLYLPTKRRTDDIIDIKRHFLHAHSLSFVHPTSGKKVFFSSKLPEDMANKLERMETIDSLSPLTD